MPAKRASGACTTPAMAWIDTPRPATRVSRDFEVAGWAFKDGVGLARVEVTLDGDVDRSSPTTAQQHAGIRGVSGAISNDPQHPDVGFTARVTRRRGVAGRALARPAPASGATAASRSGRNSRCAIVDDAESAQGKA